MLRFGSIFLIAICAYFFISAKSNQRASSSAEVLLFTNPICKKPCADARAFLGQRVAFEEIVVYRGGQNWQKFVDRDGQDQLPLIAIGTSNLQGFNPLFATEALATNLGLNALSDAEQQAYSANFDASGDPRLVMYATRSCKFCKQARQYFAANNIVFDERDIELDLNAKTDFQTLWGTGTPLLFYGYERADGFNPATFQQDLNL